MEGETKLKEASFEFKAGPGGLIEVPAIMIYGMPGSNIFLDIFANFTQFESPVVNSSWSLGF